MRYVIPYVGLAGLLALGGCNNTRLGVLGRNDGPAPVSGPTPTAAALVKYMDDNAQRVQSIRCDDIDLHVAQGLGIIRSGSLPARLACQRPRNFRLGAQMGGVEQVDIGSNDQEFWFWIKQSDTPYQFYCPYAALNEGRSVKLPFPFQPEWVMETLGMGNYGPATNYQLVVEPDKYRLIQKTTGPQGNPVKKVIVFQRREVQGNAPQITDYLLIDERTNQEICSAKVHEVQKDARGGIVPRRMTLNYPEMKVKMTLTMSRAAINPSLPPTLFIRQPLRNGQNYNLATGRLDGQPSSFQRASGIGAQ
jgi:hypothetical protein